VYPPTPPFAKKRLEDIENKQSVAPKERPREFERATKSRWKRGADAIFNGWVEGSLGLAGRLLSNPNGDMARTIRYFTRWVYLFKSNKGQ